MIGVFDRSHYEDVLDRAGARAGAAEEIERRYDAINDFEKRLVDDGTTVVKCMLHISAEEQKERLLARLDDPTKHWKFNPGDIDERGRWAGLPGGLRDRAGAHQHRARALAGRARATASGTATSRSRRCCSRRCARLDPTGRGRTTTSRSSGAGSREEPGA